MDDAIKQRDRERVEQLIRNIASEIKLERLGRPYSLLPPVPYHFPQYSKCDTFRSTNVIASGLEIEVLYKHYGMPRGIPHVIATLPAVRYGEEFADFSIEMFGLQGDVDQPDEINRLAARTIGDNMVVSNADPDSIPLGAGLSFSVSDELGNRLKLLAWRWRVFMDNSSLCLENNWQRNDLTGGGWIPYILGIVYDNPEKMVKDAVRFAPAFRLCNLVGAELGERRGGKQYAKVNATDKELQELGKQYIELKEKLKNIRTECNRYIKQKKDWRAHLRTDYSVFIEYPDVLEKMDNPDKPTYTPSNLAIEIAARRSIKTYKNFSVTAKRLKELMILPNNNSK